MAQGFLLINDTVDIYRLNRTGDKESYDVTPVLSSIKAQVIPASSEILAVFPGQPSYQLYEIFIYEMTPIENGDKLIGALGEFIVRGEAQIVNTSVLKFQQLVGEMVSGN